jgi:hypothetical protein
MKFVIPRPTKYNRGGKWGWIDALTDRVDQRITTKTGGKKQLNFGTFKWKYRLVLIQDCFEFPKFSAWGRWGFIKYVRT